MRVIGGSAKGRTLQAVPGDGTRPVLDRVKTSLFDILRPELPNMRVLDLFGGSGSIGIEALSQGAAHCTFVELNPRAVETIKRNVDHTGFTDQAEIRSGDAFRFLKSSRETFDLIYVAPPQYKGLWEEAVRTIAERPSLVSNTGMIVAQIDPKEYEQLSLQDFVEDQQRAYGKTVLVFYRKR